MDKPPFSPLGFGLGLRPSHYQDIITTKPKVDWFEIVTENFTIPGGKPWYYLDKIRELYPIVMHGVSLSIGSTDPINFNYLKQVKALSKKINPKWISDHLCWTGVNNLNMHDLLPMPYTEEALWHIVNRVQQVQDYLQTPILLENVSSYINYKTSHFTEWEFLNTIAKESGCYILLDINNIYVSAINHNFDPKEYVDAIDPSKVVQFHLAGHNNCGNYIIDTHDAKIIEPIWQLYHYAYAKIPHASVMIERDDNIPPLTELLSELEYAKNIVKDIKVAA